MFYKFAREIVRVFFYIFIGKPKIIAKENLAEAESGSVILCANHLSNWDPVILAMIYKRHIAFMAKEALFENPIFAKMMYMAGMFPVSRDGNDIKAIKSALAVLKNNETLGIFPEGRRYFDGEVHELKDGVAMLAHKTKAKVLPVGIKGRVGLFKRAVVEIGKPVDFSEYLDKKGDAEVYKEMSVVLQKELSRLAMNGEK